MKLKWGVFFGCINEEQLIEAKIDWALRHGMAVSVAEGCHPDYKGPTDPNGLSADATTEILAGYGNKIKWLALGRVEEQRILRDQAYKNLPQDLDVVIMSDVDEFINDEDLNYLDIIFDRKKDLKHILTNSYIFLDNEMCAPHVQRKESAPIAYNQNTTLHLGEWHERIFRYNKWYAYDKSPFIINDIWGRFIISDSAYFGDRFLLPDTYILHYKNFKMEEAKARLKMYKERGDKADYVEEWEILEEHKKKYEGKHPEEIMRLLNEIDNKS